MPSLPIPVFGSLVLLFLFVRLWVRQGRLTPISGFLFVCAAQTLIIALGQHYQVPGMLVLQPITATLIAPIAWLAYQATAVRSLRVSDLVHFTPTLITIVAITILPLTLDLLIPAVFLVYGSALFVQALKGPDAQPKAPLASGNVPGLIWLVISLFLIASAFSDMIIIVAQIAGAGYLQPWIISIYSVGNLLVMGFLGVSGYLETEEEDTPEPEPEKPDTEIWTKVESYMKERKPYLDPDLTLVKLARKTGIPAKMLSTTINRATGGNVSRYVNDARIQTAMSAMRDGETVTQAMLACGFNTKSNFNREFLRVAGTSPRKWLAEIESGPN